MLKGDDDDDDDDDDNNNNNNNNNNNVYLFTPRINNLLASFEDDTHKREQQKTS